jgi:adenylosuccinate synthase
MHLVPSGILYPDCTCVVGAGVVIDPVALLKEMDDLAARGIDLRNLKISDRAHVVLPFHPLLDRLEETQRADDEIGTTRRGIGPAYADKVARRGIRMTDLTDAATLRRQVSRVLADKNLILTRVYDHEPLDEHAILATLLDAGERLRPLIVPSEVIIQDALLDGKEVLVECAQGPMLDVDYGTYPYVTSSSPTAAGACQGAGIAPTHVERVIAVFKAYSTRVGSGPMPTELHDEIGQLIRDRGREYGTSTGRPRRTGWFDAVAGRYVTRLNGVTEIALTLVDVLDVLDEINVCTGYQSFGHTYHHVPARQDILATCKPIYETISGWDSDITAARTADDLPPATLDYVHFLAKTLSAPISLVGVGPAREQLVPMTASAAEIPLELPAATTAV